MKKISLTGKKCLPYYRLAWSELFAKGKWAFLDMNWLAHLYLSENNVEHRLGNILADVVKGKDRKQLSDGIRRGISCHQTIDAFTDFHPLVLGCKQYFHPEIRIFAGIILDVYFDHLLAVNWPRYSDTSLDQFLSEIYQSFISYPGELPEKIRTQLGRIATEDWLGSYRTLEGIEKTLARISLRIKRPVSLQHSIRELTENRLPIEKAFHLFFPQLRAHVLSWSERQAPPG